MEKMLEDINQVEMIREKLINNYLDLESIEELLLFFHPTNHALWILKTIPGINFRPLRARSTSFESFNIQVDAIRKTIADKCPFEFYIAGLKFITKLDDWNIEDLARNHDIFLFKMNNI